VIGDWGWRIGLAKWRVAGWTEEKAPASEGGRYRELDPFEGGFGVAGRGDGLRRKNGEAGEGGD